MLLFLMLLASLTTTPLPSNTENSGIDIDYATYFQYSVIVHQGEIVTINLYDENGTLLDSITHDYPGVYNGTFFLGYLNGNVDEGSWYATCVWSDGTPPYPIVTHRFYFPDDFVYYPPWIHRYHF